MMPAAAEATKQWEAVIQNLRPYGIRMMADRRGSIELVYNEGRQSVDIIPKLRHRVNLAK